MNQTKDIFSLSKLTESAAYLTSGISNAIKELMMIRLQEGITVQEADKLLFPLMNMRGVITYIGMALALLEDYADEDRILKERIHNCLHGPELKTAVDLVNECTEMDRRALMMKDHRDFDEAYQKMKDLDKRITAEFGELRENEGETEDEA